MAFSKIKQQVPRNVKKDGRHGASLEKTYAIVEELCLPIVSDDLSYQAVVVTKDDLPRA